MITSPLTRIDTDHPGYYLLRQASGDWIRCWEPVSGHYSPPRFEPGYTWTEIEVPSDLMDKIGLVIGRDGIRFCQIGDEIACPYIFYRQEKNLIEAWGPVGAVVRAHFALRAHMAHVQNRASFVPPSGEEGL